jgi:hypothetical protein
VPKRTREVLAGSLIVAGAVALLASLFLTWSHQFSASFLATEGGSAVLRGIPHDPTAWQVYSIADVLLALLASGLVAAALVGRRRIRVVLLVFVAIALAFVLHAVGSPPTNAANVFDPSLDGYVPNSSAAGVGETIAILGLAVAGLGLGISLIRLGDEGLDSG